MLYFEDETVCDKRRLYFVEFKAFGYGLRRALTCPARRDFDWLELEAMVDQPIRERSCARSSSSGDRPEVRSP
jgi:hypothetical protein